LLIRLDRVYLNLVYIDEKDVCRFRRILGYRKKAGSDDESVVFTPCLMRVQDGVRHGQLLPPEQLGDSEKFKHAGVSKMLSYGRHPWTFSNRRIGDKRIIDLLAEIPKKDRPMFGRITYPVFYLVTSERNREVRLRDSSAALRHLAQTPGYNIMLAPSENMVKLADKLARPLPGNKLAWPFKFFCRAGVVAADPATMYDWSLVPNEAIKEDIGIEELGT
jgi:hypothetical protein